jgi:hypothetical protein
MGGDARPIDTTADQVGHYYFSAPANEAVHGGGCVPFSSGIPPPVASPVLDLANHGTGTTSQLTFTGGDEIASSRSFSGAAVGGAVGGVIAGVLVLVPVTALLVVIICHSKRKQGKQRDHAMDNAGYEEGMCMPYNN